MTAKEFSFNRLA